MTIMTIWKDEINTCESVPETDDGFLIDHSCNNRQWSDSLTTQHTANGRVIATTSDANCFTTKSLSCIEMQNDDVPFQTDEGDLSSLCEYLGSIEMTDAKQIHADISRLSNKDPETTETNTKPEINPENVIVQDRDGDTFIHTGIILQEISFVLMCLKHVKSPAWLDFENKLSQTPLHLAVLTNQIVIVRRLLVGGANIESRDRDGNTALHLACQKGLLEIVKSLLEPVRYNETKQNKYEIPYQKIPQNLEICNYVGINCLHIAALKGNVEIVELLIDKGADGNSKDIKTGRTILHTACLNRNLEIVKLLLKHKSCNINARAYDGYTPFDLARVGGNKQIIMELAVTGAQYGESDDDMEE